MEKYTRPVYYYETDKMGIVHNANYLRIFEEARIFFMQQAGVPYSKMEDDGVMIPQTEAHVNYKHTLQFGEEFNVDVKLIYYNGVRMKLEYEIRRKGDDILIATGSTGHCFIDGETRVPLSLKKRLPHDSRVLEEHLSVVE